jgi:hypothetical protein
MDFEIKHRNLTAEEKSFVKSKMLEVSGILTKWSKIIPDTNIAKIKKAFLSNKVLVDNSDWRIDQKIVKNFQEKVVPELGESVEMAVLRSFVLVCKKIAKTSSKRVFAQTKINDSCEDIFQESIRIVLHTMYYYSQENIEPSTYIINALKKEINRSIRYHYCVTSPISVKDNELKMQMTDFIGRNPNSTLDEIFEFFKANHRVQSFFKINSMLKTLVRENDDEKKFLENIPCKKSFQDEVECLDTVEFLKKIFFPEAQEILNLNAKEIKILQFGIRLNFERGWQILCSKEENVSRQRLGQIYESVLKKIRKNASKIANFSF